MQKIETAERLGIENRIRVILMTKPYFISDTVKAKIWKQTELVELFDKGKVLLKMPTRIDLPYYKFRKFTHRDGTGLVIVEGNFGLALMRADEQTTLSPDDCQLVGFVNRSRFVWCGGSQDRWNASPEM